MISWWETDFLISGYDYCNMIVFTTARLELALVLVIYSVSKSSD